MYGFALQKARKDRRAQLRRAAIENLGKPVALDLEHLALMLDEGVLSYYAPVVRRRLMLRGLTASGPESAALAAALGLAPAELERETHAPIFDETGAASLIEAQVVEEIPETAEPDRIQAPAI